MTETLTQRVHVGGRRVFVGAVHYTFGPGEAGYIEKECPGATAAKRWIAEAIRILKAAGAR